MKITFAILITVVVGCSEKPNDPNEMPEEIIYPQVAGKWSASMFEQVVGGTRKKGFHLDLQQTTDVAASTSIIQGVFTIVDSNSLSSSQGTIDGTASFTVTPKHPYADLLAMIEFRYTPGTPKGYYKIEIADSVRLVGDLKGFSSYGVADESTFVFYRSQ